jgi:hypothetical protein
MEYVLFCRSCGITVTEIRADNDTVIKDQNVQDWANNNAIRFTYTGSYMHESNGVPERYWRTLMEMTIAFLLTSGLPLKFWVHAALHANFIRARLPHKSLKYKIPFQLWFNKPANLRRVRIFGSSCYAHIDSSKRKKLEPKANKCLYLGQLEDSTAMVLFDTVEHIVIHAGMVKFFEEYDRFGKLVDREQPRRDELEELMKTHERRGVQDDIFNSFPTNVPISVPSAQGTVINFNHAGFKVGCSKCRNSPGGCAECNPQFIARKHMRPGTVQQRPQRNVAYTPPVLPDQNLSEAPPPAENQTPPEVPTQNTESAPMETSEQETTPQVQTPKGPSPTEENLDSEGNQIQLLKPQNQILLKLKSLDSVLEYGVYTADQIVYAIVLINLNNSNVWIKLENLLGFETKANKPLYNSIVNLLAADKDKLNAYAPLFQKGTTDFDTGPATGVICALDYSSRPLPADGDDSGLDFYRLIFDDGSSIFAAESELRNRPQGIAAIRNLRHMCSLKPFSQSYLQIKAIYGWTTDDWMFNPKKFRQINKKLGPFDVDACCDPAGSNKLLEKFWSDTLNQSFKGLSVWCFCPFHKLSKYLKHAIEQVYKSPADTSVVFPVPHWPTAVWWPLILEYFDQCEVIPAGTNLFTAPHPTHNYRVDCGATQWDTWIVRTKTFSDRHDLKSLGRLRINKISNDDELHTDTALEEAVKFAEPPQSYLEAMASPEAKHWEKSTSKEVSGLEKQESWDYERSDS